MQIKKMLSVSLLFLGVLGSAQAQTCGTTISSYPYIENFDGATASGWTSGGTNSSWVLGKPAKAVINSAASGTKSWVTNLGSSYNASEQSYVESPCFNFTAIAQPVIEMKVWWNTDFSNDGAVLQTSFNGGTTWENVGLKGDPNNWFNDNTINAGPGGQPAATAQGWSGRTSTGNGSNGWVIVKHALTGMGGKASVKVRIAFGSDALTQDDGFAFDNVVIYDNPANDAGIASITSPVATVPVSTSQPITVTVKNYGTSPLTAATLGFSVDGVAQPTFPWTGNLAVNATSAAVTIGNFTFPAGPHTIKTWSKLPNAATDGNPTNDSLQINISTCSVLNGSYTINKNAPATATNFTSFGAASLYLGGCGVSGPVTFTVAPNSGPYNEQIILPVIPGTSATNTVTFEGSGNTLAATTTPTNPGVIIFNGADYVKINNFKIAVDPALTIASGVQLINASDNDIISNCTIDFSLVNTSSTLSGILIGTPANAIGNYANNLLVQNNIINGGYSGISLNGSFTTNTTNGIRIINNQIRDTYFYGIYVNTGGNGTVIERNDIYRPNRLNASTLYGIYISGSATNMIVNRNRIHNTHDAAVLTSGSVFGVYTTSPATAGNENIIKNNVIYNLNNNGGTVYGLFNSGANHTYFYHNTVSADNPAYSYSFLRGMNFSTAGTNIKFINNIISLTCPAPMKHAIYLGATPVSLVSNNNDLFVGTTGKVGFLSGDKATLADWKAVNTNAYDQNSVSIDPQFVTSSYLQPLVATLDNIGQPLPAVTDDINGAIRSTTTPDMGAYEFTPATIDAGVTAINTPTSPVSPGSQAVSVTLKNFGTTTLTSATIGWKVNGVAQPDQTWSGSLANLQSTATPIAIGSYNFGSGNHTVKVWSKNPNGTTDQLAANDTTILNIVSCTPLSGNYTINKNNPTAGTNFHSISEAAAKLNSCGVSGPVTLTVTTGTGPYNEQIEIGNIPYTSATNTVTFEGSGNSVSVTQVGARPGIIVLNGSKYVKLNNFVINLDATATAGWGIQMLNGTNFNTISNNTINLPIAASSSSINGIIGGFATGTAGNNVSNTKIQNNIINGGYNGIQINGNTGGLDCVNNQITGNQVKDSYTYAIYVSNATGALIEGNDISRPNQTSGTTMYGIYLSGSTLNSIISKNRIHNTHDIITTGTLSLYGITNSAFATVGNENIIKNNLIYNFSAVNGYLYGLYNSAGTGAYYYHNTVASNPAVTYNTLRGLHFTASSTNTKAINNIISLPGTATTKHAIYVVNPIVNFQSDNNDFYIGGSGNIGYLTTDKPTLADWKLTAFDQNSVSIDPVFVSTATGNLKPTAPTLDNLGQPVASITEDILGAVRNATTPDMGAYEFGIPANDAGIVAISGPSATACGLTATETITVTIRNYGTAPQTTIPVTYSLNGTPIPANETFTGSIAPGTTATYTFTTKANLSTSGTYEIIAKTLLAGDLVTVNDADTLTVVNSLIPGTPVPFDFETAATGITRFRKVTNPKSAITEGAGASNGATSTKGMIMDGVDNINWITPTVATDTWTSNPDHFAGAYICITPSNFAYPDSLWMTFDLKQLFKTTNAFTNFRVTLNGTQVGPTYRPPFAGTPINWQKVKVDLTAFKNASTLMIGLESSAKEAYANGTGTANLVDNITFKQHVAQPINGIHNDMLAHQIHVFPNPSNGQFNIDLPKGKIYELEVTDLTGKALMKKTVKDSAQLNLDGTAKGIYLLKVSGENGAAVRKLIVE